LADSPVLIIRLRIMKKILLFILVIAGIMPIAANAAGTLGISVTILSKSDGSEGDLSSNSSLWFSIQPGGNQSREFLINSASNVTQQVKFELYQVKYIDGVATIDASQKADAAKWVTFTPNTLNLKPREITKVKMAFNVPDGTKFGNYDGFLRVIASGESNPKDKDAKVQAVITNSLAFDQKFWLGVGDGEFLKTDFELDSVKGLIRNDKKYILVKTDNTGGTPIAPRGSIQLQDMVFAENKLGPLDAAASEILPGESGWVAAEVPFSTTDGKWKIFASVSQGNIVKTKTFEEDIKFVEESNGLKLPWQWILVLGFGAMLLLGIRMVISPKKINLNMRLKKPAKSQATSLDQLSIEELEALIENRTNELKKVNQKAPVKKATKKKAVAKKAAKKPVKKAAKQAATKPTAKSGSKKVAKKTVKKRAKQATKGSR